MHRFNQQGICRMCLIKETFFQPPCTNLTDRAYAACASLKGLSSNHHAPI
jgi:hypothetical protein